MTGARLLLAGSVIIMGCGASDESRVQFGVYGYEDVFRPLLTVSAIAGDWSVVLRGDEIGTPERPHRSDEFRTPDHGTLHITAVLARPGEEPMATASIELDIRRDWAWGVDVFLSERNPTELCFGCIGHVAVAVPDDLIPDVADSLFLVWGGNWISDPVVY